MKMNEETIERLAYRLIRREIRRFDRTTTDSEVANYVRGVVDLQTQLYEEFNKVDGEDVDRKLPKVTPVYGNNEVVTKLL